MTHPTEALFEGEKPFPALSACEHFAGSEKLIAKAMDLQKELGPIFDITCDCEDGAAAGNERAHAEMVAIRHAATRLGQPRLDGCTLWVTLEPCAMCAAAIALSRIEALRFAAEDPKGGGVVNGPRFFSQPTCHHRPDVLSGIGEDEAAAQLRSFFEARRS